MKILHMSDLHIGKMLHRYSLEDEQKSVLDSIVKKTKEIRPDVILIAGDIYDKAVPPARAYKVFDHFLTSLASVSVPILIIAGNHDSPDRLQYGNSFFRNHGIHISVMPPRKEQEHLEKIVLTDEYGDVNFYLLPFTKPSYVRHLFEDVKDLDYEKAISLLLEREDIDWDQRNILVSHQFFVSGNGDPERSGSELQYVGGLDSVHTSVIEKFDYVALGHIHKHQIVGADHIRYSGTPMKYSVSEENDVKGMVLVTIAEKDAGIKCEHIPLSCMRDIRSLKGTVKDIIATADKCADDYVSITVTDEVIKRPKDELSEHFPRILEIRVDNTQTRALLSEVDDDNIELDPVDAFRKFYREMNSRLLSSEEEKVIKNIIKDITDGGEDDETTEN